MRNMKYLKKFFEYFSFEKIVNLYKEANMPFWYIWSGMTMPFVQFYYYEDYNINIKERELNGNKNK